MRFRRSGSEGASEFERLFPPSEGLSIVDGDTRDALVEMLDRMTNRERPSRDYFDGVLHLSGTRIEYIRPVDMDTEAAIDDMGTLQMDVTGIFAPETVRNMRFNIVSRHLAELGHEDSACLLEGEFAGHPLPGKYFDPKPILPDAVAHAERAMVFHDMLKRMHETGESTSGSLQFNVSDPPFVQAERQARHEAWLAEIDAEEETFELPASFYQR